MTPEDDRVNLELVDTDALIAEVLRRHPHGVVAVDRPVQGDPAKSEAKFYFEGGLSGALGLTVRLQKRLLDVAGEHWEDM